MHNRLLREEIASRYFHVFGDESFFSAIDNVLVGKKTEGEYGRVSPKTSRREKVFGKHRSQE